MGGCPQHLGLWVSHMPRALLDVGEENRLSPDGGTASPTSLPPTQPLPRPHSSPFHPSVGVIVGALTIMFSLTFLLLLYVKHCRRTVGAGRPYGSFASSSGRRNSGVGRAVVESLPVFRFGSLRGRKEGLECAVCLSPFDSEELLRLLPKCKHAFHVECVDTWLDAHSTCPLCRHRVDPEDVLLAFHEYEPLAGPKPHPADAEGPSLPPPSLSKAEGVVVAGQHLPAAAFGFFRPGRISGRHSSAGEKCSNPALQVVVHRANSDSPTLRNSVDNVLKKASMVCFDRGVRKDRLLLATENKAAESTMQQRFGHQIVVSGEVDPAVPGGPNSTAVLGRWSDIRPQDLLFLQREMILADGCGRRSESRVRASCSGDKAVIGLRSVSEITGVSRFAAGSGGAPLARAEEERALRRWLALASKRAGRWLGRQSESDGPNR